LTSMEAVKSDRFRSLTENVGAFRVREKTLLCPEMNRLGSHLIAAAFRAFGCNAVVMETYAGLDLGKEFTSGKECFPCQVTVGDILLYLKKEKEKLGTGFDAENYIYFMPEADGPCRFGMYNKYQRIVLDSFPEFRKLKIGAITSKNSYSLLGMIDEKQTTRFRKAAYFSVVVGDILDRLLWRIRPYEKKPGMADAFIERALKTMIGGFELHSPGLNFDRILDMLGGLVEEGRDIIDPAIPPKPLIGIVGEIYLRTHVQSNQDVIRMLERYGAEVVNASLAEWVNYTSYDRMREDRMGLYFSLKQFRLGPMMRHLKNVLSYSLELYYQHMRQDQVYKRVQKLIDIHSDHRVDHLEKVLLEDDLFSFDVGTEACLSIAGIIEYVRNGYNGVLNVYPFTCMPSTVTSAVIRPIMNRMEVPYLDTPYDGTFQPGREAAVRTFMYQAQQHYRRNGRKDLDRS
jgi:predicted nucleotide-binding protein (sugar kinase/HSP70/actin superfamily)